MDVGAEFDQASSFAAALMCSGDNHLESVFQASSINCDDPLDTLRAPCVSRNAQAQRGVLDHKSLKKSIRGSIFSRQSDWLH